MTDPKRPAQVPPEARWNAGENEWELGAGKKRKEVGVWTWWRPGGEIVCRSTFGRPGVLDGPFQRFHLNGEVAREGQFKNGKEVGLHTWHFSSGRTVEPYYFEHILSVSRDVRKVVVDYKNGTSFSQLAETARFFDAKGVETDRQGEPLGRENEDVDIPIVPGRDLPKMIRLLFGKKRPVPKSQAEVERFQAAMKGVDASKIRFFGHPTDEYGTWLLDGTDRWDTMDYETWIGCLERAIDPSRDYDGTDGSLQGCAGFVWLPFCGLVGVAYQQNEGGVDAYMASGIAKEKTATVYSWLTSHTSGAHYDLRFDAPSISQLLCWLCDREMNDGGDDDGATGSLPELRFTAPQPKVDPEKYFQGRQDRKGYDPSSDPLILYWRAQWIVSCLVGVEPSLLRKILDNSKMIASWEEWRVHPSPRPTSILYWLFHQYIYGNAAALAEVVAKARRVKGVRLIDDLVKLLSKKNPELPGYPIELARKALRAAGEKIGGAPELTVANKEAAALLDEFERSPNAFEGPNPWYRSGKEAAKVRRFAELVADRELVRKKLEKALKVPENKPGATRGLLLAWGKLATGYPEFKKAVSTKQLGFQRLYELGAAYARFLDDPRARKDLLKLAETWLKNSWSDSHSSEPVWTLLTRDSAETRAVVAKLLKKQTFGATNWDVALAAVDAAATFKMKDVAPALRRAVEEGLGRVDDPSRARVARALAELEGKAALPFLRERLRSAGDRDRAALISAILRLSPGEVLKDARAILTTPFKKLDTDTNTRAHKLEAVIQGARGVKALAPELKALATRADVPAPLRKLAVDAYS